MFHGKLIAIVLIVILVGMSQLVTAQGVAPQATCTGSALQALQAAAAPLDYAATCAVFVPCVAEGVTVSVCQLRAALDASSRCPAADITCADRSLLMAAALDSIYADGYLPMPDETQVVAALETGFGLMNAGEYAEAAAHYATLENSRLNPMLMLSRALARRLAGDSASALNDIDVALAHSPTHALSHYLRIMVLGAMGQTEDAAYTTYTLAGIVGADPDVAALVTALQTTFPLDEARFENWQLYPVFGRSGGPSGAALRDLHHQPARIVRLVRDAAGAVALFDYFNAEEAWFYGDARPLIVRFPAGGLATRLASSDGSTELRLIPVDVGYELSDSPTGFEFSLHNRYLLVPEGAPDPRSTYASIHCDVLSVAAEGIFVTDIRTLVEVPTAIAVYDQPNGNVIITPPFVQLLDETRCLDETAWWQVDAGAAATGWVSLNDEEVILLWAVSGNVEPLYCPGTLTPRLGTLTRGRVIPGLGANALRSEPKRDSTQVGTLPEGAEFAVTSDPVCADGLVWFWVEAGGMSGWTAEGDANIYWLEPLAP